MMGPLPRRRTLPAGRSAGVLLVVLGSSIGGMTPRLAPTVAFAAEDPRVEAKREVERAEVQYKLGRFDEALEGYSRAYELVNAPGLLFNIGQCHKNLKSYERAIFFFQEYLREAKRPERR
ncbi:MAG TPA: tetratricopeptide repeat protein, partial [Polyangia bacterium]